MDRIKPESRRMGSVRINSYPIQILSYLMRREMGVQMVSCGSAIEAEELH
jgi:hypothetical protein